MGKYWWWGLKIAIQPIVIVQSEFLGATSVACAHLLKLKYWKGPYICCHGQQISFQPFALDIKTAHSCSVMISMNAVILWLEYWAAHSHSVKIAMHMSKYIFRLGRHLSLLIDTSIYIRYWTFWLTSKTLHYIELHNTQESFKMILWDLWSILSHEAFVEMKSMRTTNIQRSKVIIIVMA